MTPPASSPKPVDLSKFRCHMCGNCCRGDGYVVLTEEDIAGMAERLDLEREDFLGTYARWEAKMRKWVLLDQEDELKSCIFLEPDQSCAVHEDKPKQCREFPFKWRSPNIEDYCAGWRAMVGLPPAEKQTMTEGEDAKDEGRRIMD